MNYILGSKGINGGVGEMDPNKTFGGFWKILREIWELFVQNLKENLIKFRTAPMMIHDMVADFSV